MKEEQPFCECGCGERVTKSGNRFISHHHRRGTTLSKEHLKKLRDRKIPPEEMEKMKKYWADQNNRDAASNRTSEYFKSVENRDNHSKIMLVYYEEHPEFGDNHSKLMKDVWQDHPEVYDDRNERMGVRMKNLWSDHPDIWDRRNDMMRGGNDIVNHHYLYDHADLSKYTMFMTRSDHTAMHDRMHGDGYEVPHINSLNDGNGLWGYQ
jgi:hypothetical protein